jgi:acetate kinase
MADCLNCKNCIRREVYDGQWGRFIYSRDCSAKVSVIANGKLNPWDMECDKFEYGEAKIVPMTEEEKQEYDTYYSPQPENENLKEICNTLSDDNLCNIEKKFKALGIKIRKWNGKYKSWYQILKELSKKWNKLK